MIMVGVRCVSDHASLEAFGDEGGPGLAEDGADDFAVVDEQLVEEALVGPAADLGAAEAVDLVDAGEGGALILRDVDMYRPAVQLTQHPSATASCRCRLVSKQFRRKDASSRGNHGAGPAGWL